MVYFMQSTDKTGPIKIGNSTEPLRRLSEIQRATKKPMMILLTLKGGVPTESLLHKMFSHLCLHGEWFEPSSELISFIDNPDISKLSKFSVPMRKARRLAKSRKNRY